MKKLEIKFTELPYAVEEALNRLRVNIKFCGKNIQKIMVTSSFPNEGKSFASLNLWRMLAEAGIKTAFVDLDLRKSNINKTLGIKNENEELIGIDHYLSGMAEYNDVVYETNIENAYIVPSVHMLENPANLIEDPRFEKLLENLSKEYRYIIIDTPPIINVTDGALIASYCDGAIVVVRAKSTPKKSVRQTMQQIERSGCKILGAVLNRVPSEENVYSAYYSKYEKYGGDSQES